MRLVRLCRSSANILFPTIFFFRIQRCNSFPFQPRSHLGPLISSLGCFSKFPRIPMLSYTPNMALFSFHRSTTLGGWKVSLTRDNAGTLSEKLLEAVGTQPHKPLLVLPKRLPAIALVSTVAHRRSTRVKVPFKEKRSGTSATLASEGCQMGAAILRLTQRAACAGCVVVPPPANQVPAPIQTDLWTRAPLPVCSKAPKRQGSISLLRRPLQNMNSKKMNPLLSSWVPLSGERGRRPGTRRLYYPRLKTVCTVIYTFPCHGVGALWLRERMNILVEVGKSALEPGPRRERRGLGN